MQDTLEKEEIEKQDRENIPCLIIKGEKFFFPGEENAEAFKRMKPYLKSYLPPSENN